MTDNQDKIRINKDIKHVIKGTMVKQLLVNEKDSVPFMWYDIVHNSSEEIDRGEKREQQFRDAYLHKHNWKRDPKYQKAMQIPLQRLSKYGLDGYKSDDQLKKEHQRMNFKIDHPLLSKFI